MRTRLLALAITCAAGTRVDAQTVAITGGTVYPVSGPRIENATVLIRDGRITAIGANVTIPPDAQRIDATGKWVTPGLINPWTTIGIIEIPLSGGPTDQTARGTNGIAASFRPWEALNAATPLITQTRIDGITSLGIAPDGNLIAGQHAVVDLVDGTGEQMIRRAPSAMVAQLNNSANASTGARGEQISKLREILDDARAWPQRRSAVNENRSRPLSASPADLEAMQPVMTRRIPLLIAVDRAAEIDAALRIARDYNIRIAIIGGAEAWTRAAQLAAANVPVIVGGIQNIPLDFSTLGARGDNAALLRRAGVSVALYGNSYGDGASYNARNVRFEAGNAAANGMSWDDALRAVTQVPAQIFGVDDRIGTLAVGRDANLVVWSGDPFEFATRAEAVMIRGMRTQGDSREMELIRRYLTLPPRWR